MHPSIVRLLTWGRVEDDRNVSPPKKKISVHSPSRKTGESAQTGVEDCTGTYESGGLKDRRHPDKKSGHTRKSGRNKKQRDQKPGLAWISDLKKTKHNPKTQQRNWKLHRV